VLAAEQITTALFQRKAKGRKIPTGRPFARRVSHSCGNPAQGRPARTASETLSPRTEPQARLAFGIDVLRETVRRLLGRNMKRGYGRSFAL
jgi:hypothetical protein